MGVQLIPWFTSINDAVRTAHRILRNILLPHVTTFRYWGTSNPFSELYHLFGSSCPVVQTWIPTLTDSSLRATVCRDGCLGNPKFTFMEGVTVVSTVVGEEKYIGVPSGGK
jgi:hypothetical protein